MGGAEGCRQLADGNLPSVSSDLSYKSRTDFEGGSFTLSGMQPSVGKLP